MNNFIQCILSRYVDTITHLIRIFFKKKDHVILHVLVTIDD